MRRVISEGRKIPAKTVAANAAAFITITIWASTYISSKILVQRFSPLEVSLVRFFIGAVFLSMLSPPRSLRISWKSERPFAVAGFLGIFLYFLLENLALKYTYASNVSIIVATIPLLTTLFGIAAFGKNPSGLRFFASTALSLSGVCFIIFGKGRFSGLSPKGDLLALGAASVFALYTILLQKMSTKASALVTARKTVTWGLVFIAPTAFFSGSLRSLSPIAAEPYLWHFLFLGLLPSGLCFVLWSAAIADLGPVKTSRYIYFVPVITSLLSWIVLNEGITFLKITGIVLIIAGAQLKPE